MCVYVVCAFGAFVYVVVGCSVRLYSVVVCMCVYMVYVCVYFFVCPFVCA